MSKKDSDVRLQELKDLIQQFVDERDWKQFHTPKNLAMSIAIEAAELMEHFQWDDLPGPEWDATRQQEIADELADVLIYSFHFAQTCNIDVSTALQHKLEKAAKKFPAEHFSDDKPNREKYHQIKKAYRKGRQ